MVFSLNNSEIHPARQNERILDDDLQWLDDHRLPVVIPIKDEKIEFVKNAIFGVPNACPLVFVSGTTDEDHRTREQTIVQRYQNRDERDIWHIHQNNDFVRDFLKDEYPGLLENGKVVSGKREGLIIGSFVCKALGSDYIAAVDCDNWNPMAMREFVILYARGFRRGADFVAIEWRCKPKCGGGGFQWRDEGRTSRLANDYLSQLIEKHVEIDDKRPITAAGSGDHAVRLDVWDEITHAPNYSGEVNAFVQILEGSPAADIHQYKSMSPMFHDYGDDSHIRQQQIEAMLPIYRSDLADDEVRDAIKNRLGETISTESLSRYPKTADVGDSILDSKRVTRSQTTD